MSILDSHLTDAEISDLAQVSLNEIIRKLGSGVSVPIIVSTFFLNPDLLGCTMERSSLEDGIRRKIRDILPSYMFNRLPPDFAETFLGLGDLEYQNQGKYFVVFSRHDNASMLTERVSGCTKIKPEDMAIGFDEKACGFDNLELINRLFQIINGIANGGHDYLKQLGLFKIIPFKSMLSAKHNFMSQDGDAKTIALHEATAHIGAFTNSKIAAEYTGFMMDFALDEAAIDTVYRNILNQLAELGYTTKEPRGQNSQYSPVPANSLLQGMSELLDQYENQITATHGKRLTALHAAVSVGYATDSERAVLAELTPKELLQTTEHFIVFQTLKGLKTVMGENVLKCAPQRGLGSFDRINRLLSLRYS